jgi:hypothetical protein
MLDLVSIGRRCPGPAFQILDGIIGMDSRTPIFVDSSYANVRKIFGAHIASIPPTPGNKENWKWLMLNHVGT